MCYTLELLRRLSCRVDDLLHEAICECPRPLALSAADHARAATALPSKRAAGPCGWAAADFKRLPVRAWAELASLLNSIEETGKWPSMLCEISSP